MNAALMSGAAFLVAMYHYPELVQKKAASSRSASANESTLDNGKQPSRTSANDESTTPRRNNGSHESPRGRDTLRNALKVPAKAMAHSKRAPEVPVLTEVSINSSLKQPGRATARRKQVTLCLENNVTVSLSPRRD